MGARRPPGVKVLTALPGVGPFTALVILAEIGDVTPVRVDAQTRRRLRRRKTSAKASR
jgi:endonuclease III